MRCNSAGLCKSAYLFFANRLIRKTIINFVAAYCIGKNRKRVINRITAQQGRSDKYFRTAAISNKFCIVLAVRGITIVFI